jgi:hypothetical protein
MVEWIKNFGDKGKQNKHHRHLNASLQNTRWPHPKPAKPTTHTEPINANPNTNKLNGTI